MHIVHVWQEKERNTTIDFAKGVGILLMLYMHIFPECDWIGSFHMPLFFIFSGVFFKEETVAVMFRKKCRRVVIPYLVISMIGIVIQGIKDFYLGSKAQQVWQDTGYSIKEMLLGRLGGSVWFLVALFWGSVIYALIWQISKKRKILYVVLLGLCSVTGYYLGRPWTLTVMEYDAALFLVPWIAMGHLSRLLYHKVDKKYYGVIFVISLMLWLLGKDPQAVLNVALRVYVNYPYLLLRAAAVTLCVVMIGFYAKKIPLIGNYIIYSGRHTLSLLCMGNITHSILNWSKVCHNADLWVQFIVQLILFDAILILGDVIMGYAILFMKSWRNWIVSRYNMVQTGTHSDSF
jgi:fucose 4-O-acetylase-like acetyltransferase